MATFVLGSDRAGERLAPRELHVSSADLDLPGERVTELRGLLSHDEFERARKFRFERDRARYTVGRGMLRRLLGGYLSVAPEDIRFTYSEHRKPAVRRPRSNLSFNLSHSEGLALYAVCIDADVGIDVEKLRPEPATDRVPEHFFSPREVETLRSLPEAAQDAAFLRCWTRKEAFLKARGDGLTLALDSFDVTLTEREPPRLLRTAWDPDEAARWSLHDLSAWFPGYAAAAALEGRDWAIRVDPHTGGFPTSIATGTDTSSSRPASSS
jgi:4'-phosphopantetheinyl transferase